MATPSVTEELKPWPFFGYAPGSYAIQCFKCQAIVENADKRAICCLECAVKQSKAHIQDIEGRADQPPQHTELTAEEEAYARREIAEACRWHDEFGIASDAPSVGLTDVERAKAAILRELRDRKLLKYLFDPEPSNCGAYGYVEAPIELSAQEEIAEALALAALLVSDRSGVESALRAARPIVEADLEAARDQKDADWEGMSAEALRKIDAALNGTEGPEERFREALATIKDGHPNPIALARAALLVSDRSGA